MANGEFVWICSDDDEYAENIITVLKEKIESNPQIPYMYIPAVQSKIESQGNEHLYSFLLRGGMCSALISSNVFKTQNLKNTKAKSMTWYHMDIIFNMDMNSPIEILPKLINMPAENDENHWYTKAKNVLDYDTEIVNVVKKSKLPQDIKNVIYQHYKSCLPREIGRYRNKCKKDVFFVIKCMHRLKNIEYFQEEFVSLKNILFNKK